MNQSKSKMERHGALWKGVFVLSLLLAIGCEQPMHSETGQVSQPTGAGSVHEFTLDDIDGNPRSLAAYKGKVLLLVNTASFCGYTSQYEHLQRLYARYRDEGFEVLAFPANNFAGQEPGSNDQIKNFCFTRYAVQFPLFSKISVRGGDKHPLYRYLTEESPFPGEVRWNFQKYLVGRNGQVIARYRPSTVPLDEEVIEDIERALS